MPDDDLKLKTSQAEYDSLTTELIHDLVDIFSLAEDELKDLLEKADKEGWTPEELIDYIEREL